MRSTRRTIALTALLALVVGACGTAASPSPSAPASAAPTATAAGIGRPRRPRHRRSAAAASPSRARRRIRPRRSSRASSRTPTITFWTFYLSPTFDQYIKDTIARFEATYPGVKVKWEDHQGTFKDDLNNAFAAGIAPDVINLSVSEGWVSEYAGKGLLLGLDTPVPKPVQDIYFPGLWKRAAHRRRELPVPVVPGPQRRADQQGASIEKAGLDRRPPSRRRSTDLPALCKTILDKTGTVCAIRLTVSDLLAADGLRGRRQGLSTTTARPSPSTRPRAWRGCRCTSTWSRPAPSTTTVLTTDDDRVGLNAFSAGAAPFYADRPEPGPRGQGHQRHPVRQPRPWSPRRSASPASRARA